MAEAIKGLSSHLGDAAFQCGERKVGKERADEALLKHVS